MKKEKSEFRTKFEYFIVISCLLIGLSLLLYKKANEFYWSSDIMENWRQNRICTLIEEGKYNNALKLMSGSGRFQLTFNNKTHEAVFNLMSLLENVEDENYERAYSLIDRVNDEYLPERLLPLSQEAKKKATEIYGPIAAEKLRLEQEEQERRARLAKTEPYVGMPMEDISLCMIDQYTRERKSVEIDGCLQDLVVFRVYKSYLEKTYTTMYLYCNDEEIIAIDDYRDGYDAWAEEVKNEKEKQDRYNELENARKRREAAKRWNEEQEEARKIVSGYYDFEDFYDDYYDDFIDIEEAEDYYYAHGGW